MKNQEAITQSLMEQLWQNYCQRVSYAHAYADMVLAKGGQVVNDHCAFRTFNTFTGEQKAGIVAISRIVGFIVIAIGIQYIVSSIVNIIKGNF